MISTEKTYRVVGPCRLSGQPVNWNARAICWSGADWRAPVRQFIHRRFHSRWFQAVTDDRDNDYRDRYGAGVDLARRILNTEEDVEARKAGHLANRYWDSLERTGRRPDLEAMASQES